MGAKESEALNSSPLALQTTQLTVNYGHSPVLWDIALAVPEGQLIGIVGPNGAGKSTFIKACLGLVSSLSGSVEFFGKDLKSVRHRVAYVPQRESVDWDFPITVAELVVMGRYGRLGLFSRPKKEDHDRAMMYLDWVGMKNYAKRQISELSGGQQQRVFLARALAQEADLYFMDEPFAGIDMTTEKVLVDLLRRLQEAGKTIFVVHHDLNTVESYFDWLVMLNLRLVACGKTEDVFSTENLKATYGKHHVLLGEAARLSQHKQSGLL